MKYLFLILIIACGKNKTPDKYEFQYTDDSFIDSLETDARSHITHILSMTQVTGTAQITGLREQKRSLMLSNKTDLKKSILKAAVTGPSTLEQQILEWSALTIEDLKANDFLGDNLKIEIDLHSTNIRSKYLLLVENGSTKILSPWEKQMKFNLSAAELKNIEDGSSFLAFSSDWFDDQKPSVDSYRVHFSNSKEHKVLFVSKSFPFERLIKALKISQTKTIQNENLFKTDYLDDHEAWWINDFSNGDKALVLAKLSDLSKAYKQSLVRNESRLISLEGRSSEISFEKPVRANTNIKISGKTIYRKFISQTIHTTQMDSNESCRIVTTKVSKTLTRTISFDDLTSKLKLVIDGTRVPLSEKNLQFVDQDKAQYWILRIKERGQKIQLLLEKSPVEEFTRIGTWSNCHQIKLKNVSHIKKLELKLETYVEKIQD